MLLVREFILEMCAYDESGFFRVNETRHMSLMTVAN
jgi:hypothetical protein